MEATSSPSECVPPATSALAHALEASRLVRERRTAALAGREISLITRALRQEEHATHHLRQEMLEEARARAQQHRRDTQMRDMRQVYVMRPAADQLVTLRVPDSFTASDLAAHSVAEGSGCKLLVVQHRGRPLQPKALLRDFPTSAAVPFRFKAVTLWASKARLLELSDVGRPVACAREEEERSRRSVHVRAASPRLVQLSAPRRPWHPEPEPEPPGAARTMSRSSLARLSRPSTAAGE